MVAKGTPEAVADAADRYTGEYLAHLLPWQRLNP